jgi:hypothetical protein
MDGPLCVVTFPFFQAIVHSYHFAVPVDDQKIILVISFPEISEDVAVINLHYWWYMLLTDCRNPCMKQLLVGSIGFVVEDTIILVMLLVFSVSSVPPQMSILSLLSAVFVVFFTVLGVLMHIVIIIIVAVVYPLAGRTIFRSSRSNVI